MSHSSTHRKQFQNCSPFPCEERLYQLEDSVCRQFFWGLSLLVSSQNMVNQSQLAVAPLPPPGGEGDLTHLQQRLIHLPDYIPSWLLPMTWLNFPLHLCHEIFAPCGIEFNGLWQMHGFAHRPLKEKFHHLPKSLKLCLCLQPISPLQPSLICSQFLQSLGFFRMALNGITQYIAFGV